MFQRINTTYWDNAVRKATGVEADEAQLSTLGKNGFAGSQDLAFSNLHLKSSRGFSYTASLPSTPPPTLFFFKIHWFISGPQTWTCLNVPHFLFELQSGELYIALQHLGNTSHEALEFNKKVKPSMKECDRISRWLLIRKKIWDGS